MFVRGVCVWCVACGVCWCVCVLGAGAGVWAYSVWVGLITGGQSGKPQL